MPDSSFHERDYPVARAVITFLGIGLACALLAWWLGPATATEGIRDVDLSGATFVEIRTADGRVVMSGELRTRVDSLGNVEKDAALLGAHEHPVIGEIEIEIPRPGAKDHRQELEVDVISLSPHTTYDVVVNDQPAATFTTDDRGSVDVEFLPAPTR
jgi:hypothetical protein